MSEKRLSLKLSAIRERIANAPEPPVEHNSMTMAQRAVLHAYWRARAIVHVGEKPTLSAVEALCTEDIGYGRVERSKVAGVIEELRELGWDLSDLAYTRKSDQPKPKRRQPTATPRVVEEEAPEPRPKANVKKSAITRKTSQLLLDDRPLPPLPELVRRSA